MKAKSDLRGKVAARLAEVEAELGHCDAADEQLGEHAAAADHAVTSALDKRRGAIGLDADRNTVEEYFGLLGHQRRARIVAAQADEVKRRRRG